MKVDRLEALYASWVVIFAREPLRLACIVSIGKAASPIEVCRYMEVTRTYHVSTDRNITADGSANSG